MLFMLLGFQLPPILLGVKPLLYHKHTLNARKFAVATA